MNASPAADVLDLLNGATTSAAVGAAIELGLFWLLDDSAQEAATIASELQMPTRRCGYWLQVLAEAGWLDRQGNAFRTSAPARLAIVGTFSQPTWAYLAEEARERFDAIRDLPRQLRARSAQGSQTLSSTYSRLAHDQAAARRFTRMLYEVHLPVARQLASLLDLADVSTLMDLGGGSGVVALEIAARHPAIAVTVVDFAPVCAAGEEIAAERGLSHRVWFRAVDFLREPLPRGFDVVLECDVNVYNAELLRKVRDALNPGGRFLIVDQFACSPGEAAPLRTHWAFVKSLADAAYAPPDLPWIRSLFSLNGFRLANEWQVAPASSGHGFAFARGLTVLDARPMALDGEQA